MKTIVSLALAGLMSISALLPALAAQEAESVSIAESSGISESGKRRHFGKHRMRFGSGKAAYPVPAVQRMKALRRSPAAMRRMDRILSHSPNPAVCRWSLTAAFLDRIRKTENGGTLPVSVKKHSIRRNGICARQ